MSTLEEQIYAGEEYTPLEEKIFTFVRDEPFFTFATIRQYIPTTEYGDNSIYKAIQKLQDERRIRFIRFVNRKKVYTTIGQSRLPMLIKSDGEAVPASYLLKNISAQYNSKGRWDSLDKLNDLPVAIANLFLIGLMDDNSDKVQEMKLTIRALNDMRARLTTMIGYIDSVLKHPGMSGDIKKFNEAFAGDDPAMPTPEDIRDFRLFLNQKVQQ